MGGETMRFVTLVLTPSDWFGEPDEHVFTDPDLEHGPVYHATLLPDGTAVRVYELRGDPDRLGTILEEHDPDVVNYRTTDDGGGVLVYSRGDPPDALGDLLSRTQELPLMIEGPMEFRPDGALRVTVVGEARDLRSGLETVPDDVSITVERTGEYQPRLGRLFATLTDRQQEVLRTAVDLGYYEQPRGASYEDIARVVGCSPANVGEHIRRIESRIIDAVVP